MIIDDNLCQLGIIFGGIVEYGEYTCECGKFVIFLIISDWVAYQEKEDERK